MGCKFSEGKPYKVIGFYLTVFKEYDQVRIIKEMCDKCSENNVRILFFSSVSNLYTGGINDIGEAQIFKACDLSRLDALVVMSETFKHSEVLYNIVNNAIRLGVPVISVDRKIDGCISITFNYGDSFEKTVRHVVEYHGIQDLGFIAGMYDNEFGNERLACFRKVLKENNIDFKEQNLLYGDFWADPTREVLEKFINEGNSMPKAWICANDIMAIECMRVLKEHGYRIPEDIIVTGFDGIDLERFYSPRLTTSEFDVESLVKEIFKAIENHTGKTRATDDIVVNYINRLGASCGCSTIGTENIEERLYQEKFMIDDREEFIQSMYDMIAGLSNFPDLHYIFDMINPYIETVNYKELWVCLSDFFVDENMDICFLFNKDDNNYSRYTDKMRVAMHSDGKNSNKIIEFEQKDIIPNISTVLDKNDYILVTPVHLQGFTVGYMACSFDCNTFEYSYFHTFIQDFRHILETYVNRTTTERLYVTDVLTKIYNRHGFYKNIGELMRYSIKNNIPFTIISIDMDGLKKINDTFGHAEGDYAIKTIADCMMASTVKHEICSRFGGDEFIIAFCNEKGEKRANEIIASINEMLDGFNSLGEKPYSINASFGVFCRVAQKSDILDDYIRYADNLMYENKKQHKLLEKEQLRKDDNEY